MTKMLIVCTELRSYFWFCLLFFMFYIHSNIRSVIGLQCITFMTVGLGVNCKENTVLAWPGFLVFHSIRRRSLTLTSNTRTQKNVCLKKQFCGFLNNESCSNHDPVAGRRIKGRRLNTYFFLAFDLLQPVGHYLLFNLLILRQCQSKLIVIGLLIIYYCRSPF